MTVGLEPVIPNQPPSISSLEQPQSIELDRIDTDALYLLANHDVRVQVDCHSDLSELQWPWADARYVRSICVDIATLQGDALVALVNRYYPGYQETILGSESLIISKRLAVPYKSADDRAVLWVFECQAEADLLVRFDVTIEWGEPLTQRMVDGLLVAQRNPGTERGIYKQSNAESTRVFGNPHSRPESVELDDKAGTARLAYFALVNGVAEVPLLLTLSDVGEQAAWNSFLALRDSERTFQLSNKAWEDALKVARIWTPDPAFNSAVNAGKLATLQQLVHFRSGMSPATRRVEHAAVLAEGLDALDATQSRNVLAHLRRVAERHDGRMPEMLPSDPSLKGADPGRKLIGTNAAYLTALQRHLSRHFDRALLGEHYAAVRLCSEALLRARDGDLKQLTAIETMELGIALRTAMSLAVLQRDGVDAVRWESEACEFDRQAEALGATRNKQTLPPDWQRDVGRRVQSDRPAFFDDPWLGIAFAAQAVWLGCGLSFAAQADLEPVRVNPTWPRLWGWWALVNLPTNNGPLSLVWDGNRLHSTGAVRSPLTVVTHDACRVRGDEEDDIDLRFEFVDTVEGQRQVSLFRPSSGTATGGSE